MSTTAQLDSTTRADESAGFLFHAREHLRGLIRGAKRRPINRDFTAPSLAHGWLLPVLVGADDVCWGRWTHWCRVAKAQRLEPGDAIPRIEWTMPGTAGYASTMKMWQRSLDSIPQHGSWQGWGNWSYVDYLYDWLLYGFGHAGNKTLPSEPAGCEGACSRLFQTFCLEEAVAHPYDYHGDYLAENAHGRHLGFYPTPLCVSEMMAAMVCAGQDSRAESVCDPCVGTGRMLMAASNFSYRLYAMDINLTVIKATLINGYMYAPWLVRPFKFLDPVLTNPVESVRVSDVLYEQTKARPDVSGYLDDTEHDVENQPAVEPIKVRRKRGRAPVRDDTMLLALIE